MRTTNLVSAVAAFAVALTLLDMSPVEAATKRRAVTVRKVHRAPTHGAQSRVRNSQSRVLHRRTGTTRNVTKGTSSGSGSASSFVSKGNLSTGKLNLRSLPLRKAVAGNAQLRGRLAVPLNLRPKLTITHLPRPIFRHRLAPFVQRHWKAAFFWVAIAGIGYLTIPELYYDPFYTCMSGAIADSW